MKNHKLCIAIILILILAILIGINYHLTQIDKNLGIENQREEDRQEVHNQWTENYNELQIKCDRLEKLTIEQGWELYTCTAYTSKDSGCDSISSIGVDIERLSKYFNFAAVDTDLIPYGSVILIKFDTGIKAFLAVDTGEAIKGKHIDLYFVDDLDKAYNFGVRELPVRVIK